MSREHLIAVALMLDDDRRLLLADIESARARAAKALAGDRTDIARYESLSAQFEQWAFARRPEALLEVGLPVTANPPGVVAADSATDLGFLPESWRDRFREAVATGAVVVPLRMPLGSGASSTPARRKALGPPPPAQAWESQTGARGARAVQERFEAQIEECLTGGAGSLSPSDIQNTILTETLRRYVGLRGKRVDVPLEYRDGSRSRHPFPLRSLRLTDEKPRDVEELRFALLSIRHTEMDAVVDGAFLRNAEISQPRPAADTDDLVFELSREQLLALTDDGRSPVRLRMYQTGLDTAIVGFYRAVVHHLLAHPGSLAVIPMFFQSARPARQPRRGENPAARRPAREDTRKPPTSAGFREGAVWATK